MEDVTDQVLKNVTDSMNDMTRLTKVRDEAAKIEKDAKGETGYETRVRSLFESNKYYLFVYETLKTYAL